MSFCFHGKPKQWLRPRRLAQTCHQVHHHQVRPQWRKEHALSALLCKRFVATLNALGNVCNFCYIFIVICIFMLVLFISLYIKHANSFFSSFTPTFAVANAKHHIGICFFCDCIMEFWRKTEHNRVSSQDIFQCIFSIVNCTETLPSNLRTWWPASCPPSVLLSFFVVTHHTPPLSWTSRGQEMCKADTTATMVF